jgi:hypothetical protein
MVLATTGAGFVRVADSATSGQPLPEPLEIPDDDSIVREQSVLPKRMRRWTRQETNVG